MSLKRVHDELEKHTPGGNESLLAWVMTFGLELLAKVGSIGVFVLLSLIVVGLLFLVVHFT